MDVIDPCIISSVHKQRTAVSMWRLRRCATRELLLKMLILCSIGTLFTDILIFRIGDFGVVLPHVLLGATAFLAVLSRQRFHQGLALTCAVIGLIEILHATLFGFITEAEWLKSFAQYVAYSWACCLLAGLKVDSTNLSKVSPWVSRLSILLGGLGILQFIALRVGMWPRFPFQWGDYNPLYDPRAEMRAGGVAPATGFASEPSLFALGLVCLFALMLFLDRAKVVSNRKLWYVAMVALFGGITVSFSVTGIGTMVILALAAGLNISHSSKRVLPTLLGGVVIASLFAGGVFGVLHSRLQGVLAGKDNSAVVRVVVAADLVVTPLSSIETNWFGTGMGMERRELASYARVYEENSLWGNRPSKVRIHNIFATVRFLQGWIGLMFYGVIFWTVVRPMISNMRLAIPLCSLFLLYHFASGYYLTPSFWAMLCLIVVLGKYIRMSRVSVMMSTLPTIEPPPLLEENVVNLTQADQ